MYLAGPLDVTIRIRVALSGSSKSGKSDLPTISSVTADGIAGRVNSAMTNTAAAAITSEMVLVLSFMAGVVG